VHSGTSQAKNYTYGVWTYRVRPDNLKVMMTATSKGKKAFGEAIRNQRKKCGYTQESFAFHCGLHRNYISGVERGVRNISLENTIKIASSLNLKVSELFILAGM
jgi:DNA-binding XRE family transcriptional regulator